MNDATACDRDLRRDAVRAAAGRVGLDFVEVGDDPTTLYAYFLGKLPPEFRGAKPGLHRFLAINGGDVITGLRIVSVTPVVVDDPERDDHLMLRIDREGDHSPYRLALVDVAGVDPFYAEAEFRFRLDCAADLDCRPACDCPPPALDEPTPNYLAKDYPSLRQLILDRLALLVPGWQERHVPDLGITLVELLAYVGDYLSYTQDAVGTEAYLGTARQRISVRRHARLVDYRLGEGCNARAWVHVGVSADTPALAWSQIAFVTPWREGLAPAERLLSSDRLASVSPTAYEWFEPLVADAGAQVVFRAANSRIGLYTWGRRSCCLPQGATSATLRDWLPDGRTRVLNLAPGDVLVFVEVKGARTGLQADADPKRRWAVRLTEVVADEDPLITVTAGSGDAARQVPAPVLRIAWAKADALPFAWCLSAIGSAPDCAYFEDVSIALGNIVLVDHGRRQPPETLGPVPTTPGAGCCECEGVPADVAVSAARFRPALANAPLTHREPAPDSGRPASASLGQNARDALPALWLTDSAGARWNAVADLLQSGSDDRDVVAEIDNQGIAHLRFGDGRLGRTPNAGSMLGAHYRVGQGTAGNVGAGSIACIVIDGTRVDGVAFDVFNPLPAQGGTEPEPIAQAKLLAPMAFRRTLLRAITADDYATVAEQNPELQGAEAALVWTGSWYEADVALDPLARDASDPALVPAVTAALERVRRIGHDLRVGAAVYVPLWIELQACALPGYDRGHVKAALLNRFVGPTGFFSSDRLSFGQGVYLSRIVAEAMAVPGVACVDVTIFQRWGEPAKGEIDSGVLLLAADQIARLDNDPDHPEHGVLELDVGGGL